MDAQGDLKLSNPSLRKQHEKKLKATRLQNPSTRVVAKILRARESELSSNFLRAIRAKAEFC